MKKNIERLAIYSNGVTLFYEKKIPFELRDADGIVRMVTGEDFIGIVPDMVFPRYCHSLFSKEDRIIDFMNLGSDKETFPAVVEKAQWYPLEKIEFNYI